MENSSIETDTSLKALCQEVLKNYNIIPSNISIIQMGAIKTVWRVKYKDKDLCLKRLRQSIDKANFSVYAQLYVKSINGNVPAVILNSSGEAIVQHKGELFVLYEWLEGRELNFNNLNDLSYAVKGLAEFHIASKGYKPADNCRVSSKLNRWPDQYNSIMNKFLTWEMECKSNNVAPCYTSYLKVIDSIKNMGNEAIRLLESSSYKALTSQTSDSQVLCHQDFGTGNALLTKNGVIILDLDGVTLDLAARDLRKLIFKYEEPAVKWQRSILTNILEWYTQINPLSEAEKSILYIDLLFPHRFYGLVKNLFQSNKPLKAADIERIAIFEQSKLPLLKDLMNKR